MWQVTGIYIGGSWLAYELIEKIAESADQPWLPNVALVLLLIGLPVVLATAYVQERPSEDAIQETAETSSTPTSAEPTAASPGLFTARNTIVALILVAAALFTVINTGIWPIGGSENVDLAATPEAVSPDAASVVVLTLDNIGGREEVAYLSEGITEEITAQLARVPELKVISRTSAQAISEYNLTIPQIADSLGVEHVVEGSVQLFGEQIRVTAQLIHAETDNHLWADSYDGLLADLFTLQEDIAIKIASALTSAVGGIREINEGSRTEDPVAYEAYLIGKSQMHTRSSVGMLAAVEAFERAVAQDPSYAPGYAGLAMAYGLLITYGHPELDGYELYGLGMAMANRAIELDMDAAEAYAARGYLETKALSPAEPIEADFQRALELSPNSADAHGWYGHLLVREGQHDEASAQAGEAFEIDPLHPGKRYGAAFDAIASDRYDVVIREAQRALALEPTLTVPYFLHALASLLDGRPDDCLNVLGDLSPGIRAMCQHSRGEVARSMQMLDSLQSTLGSTNEPASHAEMLSYRDIAMFYAWVGDVDETLDWMERAVSWSHLAVDFRYIDSGIFDKVREDSSFQSGLERIRTRMKERLLEAAG
jgi:TolB-like protein/tetratricopeptide (TPR) repeat protein